jgi:hypothetical protein
MTETLHADEIFGHAARLRQMADRDPRTANVPRLADILLDVQALLRRYVVLNEAQTVAVTLWVAHTHAIAAADCTPYLQVTSATKRAGKTRLLEVLEAVVARPWLTGRTSTAALMRKTDAEHPTLLLDESDAALGTGSDREYAEALRGLLNSGYRRSGHHTVCVGQGAAIQARDFSTFSAKAIAGIGDLPGTIADRSIRISLRRRTSDEPIARWRERDGHAQAAASQESLVAWASHPRIIEALRDARPALPTGLGDRQCDVWEPLLAIADLAGNEWPDAARRAAIELSGAAVDTDITVELLRDIAEIIEGQSGAIAASVLLERLTADEDRRWREWRAGRPLSARGLARLLAPLEIHPDRHDTASGRLRGYRIEVLRQAIARYVPSHVSMCPKPNESGANLLNRKRPDDTAPDTYQAPKNPMDAGVGTHGQIQTPERATGHHRSDDGGDDAGIV